MEVINKIESTLSGGYHEPRVSDYFLINNPKWHLAAFLGVYLLIAGKIGPMIMANRKPFGLRPWILVLAGLNFGVYGVAIPILGWLSNFGSTAWKCAEPRDGSFLEETVLRMAYTYLWLKLADISTTLIMILRKKPGQSPFFHALRNSTLIVVVWFGLRMYARGSFIFLPFTDAILSVIRSAYYVLAAPGQTFQHHLWFKKYIIWVSLMCALLNLVHMGHHLVNSCAGPPGIMLIILAHSLGEIYIAVKQLTDRSAEKLAQLNDPPSNGKKIM